MHNPRPYGVYHPRQNSRAPAPKRPRSLKRSLTVVGVLLIVILGITIHSNQQAHAKAAAEAEAARHHIAIDKFRAALPGILSSSPLVKFSISITDSKYGESTTYNAGDHSDAASTAKLLTAALFLKKVESRQYSLEQSVGGAPASAQLKAMVSLSDDQAWANFNELLTHKALQSYADDIGMSSYDADTNSLSANDMNNLVSQIYERKLLSKAHTSLLLSYMQHTNYEDFISPAVTSPYNFYHKVGADNDEVNDTGIIASDGDNIFITIFSDGGGSYNWPDRAAKFQQITKAAISAYLD